jgi:hypothetical protein
MTRISDNELTQIEADVSGYMLEEYPISGVQLQAIIARLRETERAAGLMEPYMRYFMDRDRLRRASEAWMLPRLGVFTLSMFGGIAATAISGTMTRFLSDQSAPNFGFVVLTFVLPVVAIMFPLTNWIDWTQNERLKEGRYDAD